MPERPRALVTGAARRLGRVMALDLAGAGWDLCVHHHASAEAARTTVAEARELGAGAVALGADLTREAESAGLVARAAEALGGPLTLLVNNASIFENDRLISATRASWDRAMETNLRAPVRLTQDFAAQAPPAEADAGGEPVARAVVINMLDERVWNTDPDFMSYTLAKSALLAFTRTAAQALAPDVRVAGIGPGPTLRGSRESEAHFARQRRACLLGRGSDPEDVLAAMRFILACKAFTGQMLAVDGGQHLTWHPPDVAAPGG